MPRKRTMLNSVAAQFLCPTRILLLLALSLSFSARGSASPLQGKVVEVLDGETVIVLNINNPVKIKLLCAAVPATGQSYTDVAKQHLADLVLNKYVVVRVTGLDSPFLRGVISLADRDIGAQMIRDGVAWYDKSGASNLSKDERELYEGCEQAARKERLGLWQDESPIPPWQFREAQMPQSTSKSSYYNAPNSGPGPVPRPRRSDQSGLSNNIFNVGGLIRPGSAAGKPTFKRISQEKVDKLVRFQPEGEHFSILGPSDGVEITYPIIDGQAKLTEIHYLRGSSKGLVILMMWLKASNDNDTDASAAAGALEGLLEGMNSSAKQSGQGILVTAKPERDLRLNGYSGKQYILSGGPLSGVVRLFSKQSGDQRELYMMVVLNRSVDTTAADQFLNSFKISEK